MYCTECGHELNGKAVMCVGCGVSINNFNGNERSKYAGFWKRVLASVIDTILFSIPFFILGFIIGFADVFAYGYDPYYDDLYYSPEADIFYSLLDLLGIFIFWIYCAAFESSSYQATPGKMALGIIVTDLDGNRISFLRATARYFGTWLSGCIFCIGYMMAGWTDKKQALHDMIAGTLVVNKKSN